MIKQGESVPLFLQVYDGKGTLDVEVFVFSPSNALLFQDEMVHIVSGLYRNGEFKMPPLDFVIAQYVVNGSKDYENAVDIFYLDKGETNVADKVIQAAREIEALRKEEEESFIVGQVFEESFDDFFEGKVQ